MQRHLSLLALCCLCSAVSAAEYYLSTTGDDGNNGTSEGAAFASFWKATQVIGPGDTLTVLDGTYREQWVSISQHASAAAPITIRAQNTHGALLTFPQSGYNPHGNLLHIVDASHIVIDGLSLRGVADRDDTAVGSGHGIAIEGSHHITVRNCRIQYAGGSGITGTSYFWDGSGHRAVACDHILIEGNEISHCAYWNTYQTSGISIYQPWSSNTGTDPSGFNIRIRDNVVWGCENKVNIYGQKQGEGQWDEWTVTDGNGIIIDDFRCDQGGAGNNDPYPHQTLVENNLVVGNGGRGVHVFMSNGVTVRNNTAWGNGLTLPGDWKAQLSNVWGSNNRWYNNIGVNTAEAAAAQSRGLFFVGDDGCDFANNLVVGSIVSVNEGPNFWTQSELAAVTLQVADAGFVDAGYAPTTADFTLAAGSPAIDVGDDGAGRFAATDLAGNARPQGAGIDIGAYERVGDDPDPDPEPDPEPVVQRRVRVQAGGVRWGSDAADTPVHDGDGSTFSGIDEDEDALFSPEPEATL